jgi:hypothetical protein
MARQHAAPILLDPGSRASVPLNPFIQQGEGGLSEAQIQELVHAHPETLPIAEIDPVFAGAIAICRELRTRAGSIDNFFVSPSGFPVLVECKLWRNPEGRRQVVGQILDYAKELSQWTSSDVQREVCRSLKRDGNPLLELVQAAASTVDEVTFNDALTQNLRRGRFLLLLVGDGIREGVEAIAEYLQRHAGLHFSFGLIEFPIFQMPDGRLLVTPRVLARTSIFIRTVIALPEGHGLREERPESAGPDADDDSGALAGEQQKFWEAFLPHLKLDDPEQMVPNAPRQGYIAFYLPAPRGSCWLTVYRDLYRNTVGIFLASSRNSAGEFALSAIAEDWPEVKEELGGTARFVEHKGRNRVVDSLTVRSLVDPVPRETAFKWLAERTNTFVNVMRPRVRAAVADYMLSERLESDGS